MIRRFLAHRWRAPLGWLLLILVCGLAATTGKHTLMQEDVSLYNVILSSPGTLGSSTLNQAITDIGSNKRTLWLTQGTWNLSADVTVPANIQLYIPHGTAVSIANGKTLTLGKCPKIDEQGWLQPGTSGVVKITAPGCEIEVHKYATGGAGTLASPWTGWEPVACQNTFGKEIHYRRGYYATGLNCVLNDPSPENANLLGYTHIYGEGANSLILFRPTAGTTGEFVPATGASDVKTWMSAGAPGKLLYVLRVENLAVVSDDLTYKKRAFHFVDPRSSAFRYLSVGIGLQGSGFYDTSGNSIGFHIEGRGQNKVEHFPLISADYPLIVDGTPNEGGICYSTQSGWTGTAGFCETDTSTFEDISLEVRRYYFDPGDGAKCRANPNILIGAPTTLHRTTFRQINMNGGGYGVKWHGAPQAATSGVRFESVFWEDPCPLDPSTIGAGRITAGVGPDVIVQPNPNVYGDNAALQPASAWGYMFGMDLDTAPSWLVEDLTIENVSNLAGGNFFSVHHVNHVMIKNARQWGNGIITHHYPGFAGIVSAATNNNPGVLTITGHGLTAGTYSLPCHDFGGGWTALNTTLTATYVSANTLSIGVNTTGFGALAGTPHCDVTPAPTAYKPIALDLSGNRVSGPVYTSYPVECKGCASGSHTQTLISTDLDLVYSTPTNPIDYLSSTIHNVFPPNAIWDSIKDTNPGAIVGSYLWNPVLKCEGSNPTVGGTPISKGLISIQQIGNRKLATFTAAVGGDVSGGSGNAYLGPTSGDVFPTPSSLADQTHAVTVGRSVGITLASGTYPSAFFPPADPRIVLLKNAAGVPAFLTCADFGSGFYIVVTGAYFVD